ncbi:MAG: preprotein translocase subunit YajC [Bacteroidales bacterium]|nr:preprotein translocase subunit YajC [Bacteroidales bacterium]
MSNLLYSVILFAKQATPVGADGAATKSNPYSSIILLVLLVLAFYLFFIRPSVKKQKQQKEYQNSLAKGSNIVTIGGIHGKIVEVNETTFVIETEGSKMEIEKSAVNAEMAPKK